MRGDIGFTLNIGSHTLLLSLRLRDSVSAFVTLMQRRAAQFINKSLIFKIFITSPHFTKYINRVSCSVKIK